MRVVIPLSGLIAPHFCTYPTPGPGFTTACEWVKMRGDCSFWWYWWNWWSSLSLHKSSYVTHKKWPHTCHKIRIRFTLSTYWSNYEYKQWKSTKNIIWTDCGFDPKLGEMKDYNIGIYSFSAKRTALRSKSKDCIRVERHVYARTVVSVI
jgi:hypothetical protein